VGTVIGREGRAAVPDLKRTPHPPDRLRKYPSSPVDGHVDLVFPETGFNLSIACP
jgi:hypothetical protein